MNTGQHRHGLGNVEGGECPAFDEEARVALARLACCLAQAHLADGIVALHRGRSSIVQRLVHLSLDALELAGDFRRLGARLIGEHELYRGNGRLRLVDPQLDVATVGRSVFLELVGFRGGKRADAGRGSVGNLPFQEGGFGDESRQYAGLPQRGEQPAQLVVEGGFAAVVQKAGAHSQQGEDVGHQQHAR
jgi:hypothetical protein